MPDLPWVDAGPRDLGGEQVALLSQIPLRSYRATFRFLRDVWRVQQQLQEAAGLIGYSLRARPLSRQYWTLSVWESDRALLDFVRTPPHADVMSTLRGHMGPTRFVRWRVPGADPLPTWEHAIARAAAADRSP